MNAWQDLCACGQPKNRYAIECQICHLANRNDICVCGKTKYKNKQLCRECNHTRNLCACGLTKDKRSLVCAVCRSKEPAEKKCRGCQHTFTIETFSLRPDGKGGHKRRSRCKSCESDGAKQRHINFPEKRQAIKAASLARQKTDPVRSAKAQKAQWRRQWRKLGLNPDEVFAYIEKHGWVCAICKQGVGYRTRAVDHDHGTGKFRGILCSPCNLALGLFKDNPKLLDAAIKYLQVVENTANII